MVDGKRRTRCQHPPCRLPTSQNVVFGAGRLRSQPSKDAPAALPESSEGGETAAKATRVVAIVANQTTAKPSGNSLSVDLSKCLAEVFRNQKARASEKPPPVRACQSPKARSLAVAGPEIGSRIFWNSKLARPQPFGPSFGQAQTSFACRRQQKIPPGGDLTLARPIGLGASPLSLWTAWGHRASPPS